MNKTKMKQTHGGNLGRLPRKTKRHTGAVRVSMVAVAAVAANRAQVVYCAPAIVGDYAHKYRIKCNERMCVRVFVCVFVFTHHRSMHEYML